MPGFPMLPSSFVLVRDTPQGQEAPQRENEHSSHRHVRDYPISDLDPQKQRCSFLATAA